MASETDFKFGILAIIVSGQSDFRSIRKLFYTSKTQGKCPCIRKKDMLQRTGSLSGVSQVQNMDGKRAGLTGGMRFFSLESISIIHLDNLEQMIIS